MLHKAQVISVVAGHVRVGWLYLPCAAPTGIVGAVVTSTGKYVGWQWWQRVRGGKLGNWRANCVTPPVAHWAPPQGGYVTVRTVRGKIVARWPVPMRLTANTFSKLVHCAGQQLTTCGGYK